VKVRVFAHDKCAPLDKTGSCFLYLAERMKQLSTHSEFHFMLTTFMFTLLNAGMLNFGRAAYTNRLGAMAAGRSTISNGSLLCCGSSVTLSISRQNYQ